MKFISQLLRDGEYDAVKHLMGEYNLTIKDGRIIPATEFDLIRYGQLESFWNQRQQARKILLNSLYGALLNPSLRFNDERIGQSTTLTGRCVVQHMNAKTNEVVLGEYDYLGSVPHYSDTDSCYFTVAHILDHPTLANFVPTKENYLTLYDGIASQVNDSFAGFMHETFNTSLERGALIRAGRELVGSSALFIKKKKYAILMYEKEGERYDLGQKPGKLKAMGLDLKRADTPKVMQNFLSRVLMDTLTGSQYEDISEAVYDFRHDFKARPSWEKGSPKAVKGMTKYAAVEEDLSMTKAKQGVPKKVTTPGHVNASINWNALCELHNDLHSPRITDGTRIVVCDLFPNEFGIKNIAYPIDVSAGQLPKWFTDLPFDDDTMENKIIDMKLDNLFGVMDWTFAHTHRISADDFFSFE